MTRIFKYLQYGSLFALLLILSCTKESDEVPKQLSYVDESLHSEKLSARGGTFSLEVEWAYTQWRIVPGDVISGEEFIESASPGIAGSADGKLSKTSVSVSFKSNSTHVENSQELLLASLDGLFRKKVIITQSALGYEAFDLILDSSKTYQTISGFGGANAIWGNDYLNTKEMELAFDTEKGLGLSILRVRLPSIRNDWAGLINIIKDANARGVKVLATPWSPPSRWKSNNSINGGGYLKHENYGDFADYINEFIEYMNSNNATIDVVSIQNEPDYKVDYEGCEYTSSEMYNFVKNYAGRIKNAKVMAAESFHFNQEYTDNILNDPAAAQNIDVVGFHIYGSGKQPYPLAEEKQKEIWMSEHLYNLGSGNVPENWNSNTDPKIIWDETMEFITDIHDGMTFNWNAYVWWYIRRFYGFLGDGENGTSREVITKRGYAMSQYSKFVRPGYVRIDAEFDFGINGVKATAYKGENKIVVVIINSTTHEDGYSVNINIPQEVTTSIGYTTSIDSNQELTNLRTEEGTIAIDLPTKSISTIVLSL